MKMKLCGMLCCIMTLLPSAVKAQTLMIDHELCRFELDLTAALSADGWEGILGGTYFTSPYVGGKFSIGYASEYTPIDYYDDDYEGDYDYTMRFKFMPAIVLRTPAVVKWGSEGSVYFFAEPGCVVSPGASGSHDAKILCWDVKCGINCQCNRFIIGVGYGQSNFTLYSGHPISHEVQTGDDARFTYSGFLRLAVKM